MTRETRHIVAAVLAFFVMGVGLVSLIGIGIGQMALASWMPGRVPMALSTAMSTIATGATLLLLNHERTKR